MNLTNIIYILHDLVITSRLHCSVLRMIHWPIFV